MISKREVFCCATVLRCSRWVAVILAFAVGLATQSADAAADRVRVAGVLLLRNDVPWTPHGYNQIAFVLPPGATPTHTLFLTASRDYTPAEFWEMRLAGADSVRMQIAQTGMDPEGLYASADFRRKVIAAIAAARAAGLVVIVCVQDEQATGETHPAILPNDATRRVWDQIAPVFGQDRGVMLELFNEPEALPSAADWLAWAAAMNRTIDSVRRAGARNVLVADGLNFAETLDGAPRLHDPLGQIVYAAHPYAHRAEDQTVGRWETTFGRFARFAPVIITEWGIGYYCDANTPDAVRTFLEYLNTHRIGLAAVTWDWQSAGFGSAFYDFPRLRLSRFIGPRGLLECHTDPGKQPYLTPGEGYGAMVETWYETGRPPHRVE